MRQQPLTVFNFKKNTSTEHFYPYIYIYIYIYKKKTILVISEDELGKNSHIKADILFILKYLSSGRFLVILHYQYRTDISNCLKMWQKSNIQVWN